MSEKNQFDLTCESTLRNINPEGFTFFLAYLFSHSELFGNIRGYENSDSSGTVVKYNDRIASHS